MKTGVIFNSHNRLNGRLIAARAYLIFVESDRAPHYDPITDVRLLTSASPFQIFTTSASGKL